MKFCIAVKLTTTTFAELSIKLVVISTLHSLNILTGSSVSGNCAISVIVTHFSTWPGTTILSLIYIERKWWSWQNKCGSTFFSFKCSLSFLKLSIIMGDWSIHLPWIYIIPEFIKYKTLSVKTGKGILVYLHSKWCLTFSTTSFILNFLAYKILIISPSLKCISRPLMTFDVPGEKILSVTLGPKSFLMSKSMPLSFS